MDLTSSSEDVIQKPLLILDKHKPLTTKYSRNVRLSSNTNEIDSDIIIKVMRMNKIHHKLYNPTMVNMEWRRHFQEIINKEQGREITQGAK